MDFRGSNTGISGQGPQQTTSDILFLKRLLFLKASLDNESSINNINSLPLGEDGAFSQPVSRGSCHTRYGSRAKPGLSAATTAGQIECTTAAGDGSETLAITSGHSGGVEDQGQMLQLMPGPNGPPKTAVGRQRTRAGVAGIASGGVGFINEGKKSQGNTR